MSHSEPRQAVVVIHGIGEQRPMETLHSFVAPIIASMEIPMPAIWNKPDRLSGSYEMRRLKAQRFDSERYKRPTTDFFEYYWAPNMRDTKSSQVIAWIARMFFSRSKDANPRIRRILWATRGLALLALVFLLMGGVSAITKSWSTVFAAGTAGAFLMSSIAAVVTGSWLYTVGDAARYLDPTAANVAEREKIRRNGVALLRRLHQSGKFSRIVLVGHSLGSVIAYDIIRFAWDDYRLNFRPKGPVAQPCLVECEDAIDDLTAADTAAGGEIKDRFWRSQRDLREEMRALGNPWLVTDLVTLGSPLAHAPFLLTESPGTWDAACEQGVMPMCPPRLEDSKTSRKKCSYPVKCSAPSGQTTVDALNSSSPFACVRWTNIYFPGDIIGGPVEALGNGVDNHEVHLSGWHHFMSHLPTSHTRYWPKKPAKSKDDWARETVEKLWDAMDLDGHWAAELVARGK